MTGSESDSESSVHTEPSAGDAARNAYGPARAARGDPGVAAYRRWWLRNPLNNLWTKKPAQLDVYNRIAAGQDPAAATRGKANVQLSDLLQHGPTLDELLQNDPSICVEELPSDEAWCGTPDPSMYAAGTNHLTRDQLDAEVSKGNVVTLRQLKAHLAGASAEELDLWRQVLTVQRLREREMIELPGGRRMSLWALYDYVRNNPQLAALVERDPNLVVPAEGMTREERVRMLERIAPWRLCAGERHMTLPESVASGLGWGLLAAGTWYSRRPSRWLKGLDGVADFEYGLYAHEAQAQAALGDAWGGRAPGDVLAAPAFYRDALRAAPRMGMSLLAVASRPLPLQEVTGLWEQRLRVELDRQAAAPRAPAVLASTTAASSSGAVSGSGTETGSESMTGSEEDSSSSGIGAGGSEQLARQASARAMQERQQQQQQEQQQLRRRQQQQQQLEQEAQQRQQRQQQLQQEQLQQQAAAASRAAEAVAQPLQQPSTVAVVPQPKQQQQNMQQQQQQAAQSSLTSPAAPVDPRYRGLEQLVRLFDAPRLAQQTQLLDIRGTALREGSTVIFSAHPSGDLLVQAVSPGLVRDQRSYVLGAVRDPALTSALLGLFLDPERTLDPVFTTAAGTTLLAAANGRRTHEALSAGKQMEQATTTRAAAVAALSKHGRWELPAIGKAPAAPLLVSEVRREVTHQAIHQAFEAAVHAAVSVAPPEGVDLADDADAWRRLASARRQAGESVLRARLESLGVDVRGTFAEASTIMAQQPATVCTDLFSLARPLTTSPALPIGGSR